MTNSIKWTLFAYMAGDGGLGVTTGYLISRRNGNHWSCEKYTVFDKFDSSGPQYDGYEGTIRYSIPEKNNVTNRANQSSIGKIKREGSGKSTNLVDALKWATTTYPASNYLVTIWNHGSGWRDDRSRLPISTIKKRIIGRNKTVFKHETVIKKSVRNGIYCHR